MRTPKRELGQKVNAAPTNGPLLNLTLSSSPSPGALVLSRNERYHANPPPSVRSHFHDCADAGAAANGSISAPSMATLLTSFIVLSSSPNTYADIPAAPPPAAN